MESGGWETVGLAVQDLAVPPRLSGADCNRLSGKFGTEYVLRSEVVADVGSGVTDVRLQSRPGGLMRLKVTGNAATALYGAKGALGSLSPGEACLGTHAVWDAGLGAAYGTGMVSRHAPLEAGMVRVVRVDPSLTVRQESDARVVDILCAFHEGAIRRARDGQRVRSDRSGRKGHSVYVGARSKDSERLVRAYGKSMEARMRHPEWNVPDGLLRFESELTGRLGRGRVFTMDHMADLGGVSREEVEQMTNWLLEAAHNMVVVGAEALIRGQEALGEEPNGPEAVRLVGFWQMFNARGMDGVLALGVSRATAYRARARIEELLGAVYGTPEVALDAATRHTIEYLSRDAVVELD